VVKDVCERCGECSPGGLHSIAKGGRPRLCSECLDAAHAGEKAFWVWYHYGRVHPAVAVEDMTRYLDDGDLAREHLIDVTESDVR
jgi:hypothetical protein